jgi:hypothetical protein
MNNEDKFKIKLKELIESKEFSFDEANWIEAKKIIDSKKNNRKKFLFLFTSILFLVAAFFTIATLISKKPNYISQKEIKKVDVKSTINQANNSSAGPKIINHDSTNYQQIKKTDNNDNVIENKNEKVVPNKIIDQFEILNAGKEFKNEKRKFEKFNSKKITDTSFDLSLDVKEKSKILQHQKEKLLKPEVVKLENTNTNILNENYNSDVAKDTSEKNNFKNEYGNSLENESSIDSIAENKTRSINYNSNEIVIADSTKNDSINLSELVSHSTDSALKSKANKRSYFNFEFGVSYLFGWENATSKEAEGTNLLVGINYNYLISKKVELAIGLQYNAIKNLRNSTHKTTKTKYSFGQETEVTEISRKKMHYLTIPIKFQYLIDKKNILGIGYNFGYLVNVNSDIITYNERLNFKSNSTNSTSFGYVEGFKNYDSQFSVFYRRELFKDLSVNLEFIYGIIDIKDNALFSSTSFERNTGAKFTLIYNLNKKNKK